jgi:hypothetical protein
MGTLRPIVLLLAGAALASLALALLFAWRPEVALDGGSIRLESQLTAIASRFDDLDRRLTALEHAPAPAVINGSFEREPADLAARLEAIEESLREAQRDATREGGGHNNDSRLATWLQPVPRAADRPVAPDARTARAAAERVILDPAANEADKVRTHGELRYQGGEYSTAALSELLRIGASGADAQTRADVWRFFDGAYCPPALVGPLQRALACDPAANVREEAAETLGNHLAVPGVRASLTAALQDADEGVRAKVARTLRGVQPSHAMLQPR